MAKKAQATKKKANQQNKQQAELQKAQAQIRLLTTELDRMTAQVSDVKAKMKDQNEAEIAEIAEIIEKPVAPEAIKNKKTKLFGLIERGDVLTRKDKDRNHPQEVGKIIDQLNQTNQKADLAKSYLSLSDIEKGERLVFAVNRLSFMLERARIGDYVTMMSNTKGLLYKNLLAGIFKGVGVAIGLFLLSALVLYILNAVIDLGIPVIGDFLTEILNYMKEIKNVNI